MLESRFQYAVFDTAGTQRALLFELAGRPRLVHFYQGITHYPFIPLANEPIIAARGDRIFLLRGESAAIEGAVRRTYTRNLRSSYKTDAPSTQDHPFGSIPLKDFFNNYVSPQEKSARDGAPGRLRSHSAR